MIREWPVEPIKCFACYDLGIVIDRFKQNEQFKCRCQTEPKPLDRPDQTFLQFLWSRAGQIGDMNVQ